jgi:hypothetical protein
MGSPWALFMVLTILPKPISLFELGRAFRQYLPMLFFLAVFIFFLPLEH